MASDGHNYTQNLIEIRAMLAVNATKLDNIEKDMAEAKVMRESDHDRLGRVEIKTNILGGTVVVIGGGLVAGLLEIMFEFFTSMW